MNQLGIIDIFTVLGYLALMFGIGIYGMRKRASMEDFFLGGRSTGSFAIGCLWMSSWIGGATVVGSVDKAYAIGVSGIWYCMSMAVGCVIFAYTSAPIIQRLGAKFSCLTYPELIEQRYNGQARLIATITTFLAYIAYTAGQFLAMGLIIKAAFNLEHNTAIWLSAASIVIYTALGGFFAVTITSIFQAILIIISIVFILTPVLWGEVGGLERLVDALPSSFFDLDAWGMDKILGVSLTIILTFYTSMDSYTRCFAAKDSKSSQLGTYIAAFMVAAIALGTCFIGIAARVLIPDVPANSTTMSTLIFSYLPYGVKGIVLVGLLAAIMSTGSVCLLVASANLTRDIYQRFINPTAGARHLVMLSSFAALSVGVLATYLAIAKENVIEVLYIAFTLNSAGLFVPTLAAFIWNKGSSKAAVLSMGCSLVTVLFWYTGQHLWTDSVLFGYDPVWPGLFVSGVTYLLGAQLWPLSEVEQAQCDEFLQPVSA